MEQINLEERFVESKKIFSGKILTLRLDSVVLPNGKPATREVIEHPGAVAIVPVTAAGEIVLVRQYRHAVGKLLLEIPAGKLDAGESPDTCAHRELEEETGYVAAIMQRLTSIETTPGFSNEIIHIFVARELRSTQQHPDEDEFLNVELYSRDAVREMISDGTITDAKTIVGLMLAGITL
ncbi:nudix box signature [Lucifera butyrica]|uniref:Nudix box signature n=1 Tax=Lucifera butyrica TaxID=1351585 RepID=A0A498RAJ3_9FIRM|nr:NUDIX hydrolase [Lucifera butyrica]VBB07995.1 nudix box signature [Lucifera butyrica]